MFRDCFGWKPFDPLVFGNRQYGLGISRLCFFSAAAALALVLGTTLRAGIAGEKAGEMKPFTDKVPESDYEFKMIPIPKGTVEVEDPDNPGSMKTVEVGPFWIGETEVTWDMFDPWVDLEERAFMLDLPPDPDGITGPTPPYVPPDQGWGHKGYAALTMTYFSAKEFCRWISRENKKKYRLPTEAEWKYVCDSGWEGIDVKKSVEDYAWIATNSEGKTHPVKSKKPNKWGVYDLLGNAAEWCLGVDGKPVVCGGYFETPPEGIGCDTKIRQTKEMEKEWKAEDPQVPQSKYWLAGPKFHGFRLLCEGETE